MRWQMIGGLMEGVGVALGVGVGVEVEGVCNDNFLLDLISCDWGEEKEG